MGKDKASKGVFADYAPEYVSAGISIIPTGGESGKIPCENGYTRYVEKRPHSKTIERWVKGRPNANIGILAGPISNLTIVDVDDASIFDDAIARFGDTPIIAQTPSGGSHLYYRFNGEKGANHLEGMAIDIRAQGGPPLLIAPPSVRPKDGNQYSFIEGSLKNIGNLPAVKEGSLPLANTEANSKTLKPDNQSGIYAQGDRNNQLFNELRGIAHQYDSLDNFELAAKGLNNALMQTPLSEAEVGRTAQSVWEYKIEGRLILPGDRSAVIALEEGKALYDYPPAIALLHLLRCHHNSNHVFAVSPKGLAPKLSMSRNTVIKARDFLVDRGYLELVESSKRYKKEDGKFYSTPNQYRFSPASKYW